MEDVGVLEDPLSGGEGVVLVFHIVLHAPPQDDVELHLRVPVPMDASPVELVHAVQVKADGLLGGALQVQGHEGVVGEDLSDLHGGTSFVKKDQKVGIFSDVFCRKG